MISEEARQAMKAAGTDTLSFLMGHGVFKVNEVRAVFHLDPIPGGDWAYVLTDKGAVPLEDVEFYRPVETQPASSITDA